MKTFEEAWNEHCSDRPHVLQLMRNALNKSHVEWSDFTTLGLTEIRNYMLTQVANNSAILYCALLKSVLNIYKDESIVPCKDVSKPLKVKKQPSQQIALTEHEMWLIDQYEPKTEAEREVKARFMCEYYSLARSSDISKFTDENIRDGRIVYVSQKTCIETSVPVHKSFQKYFAERGTKEYTRASYNEIIKRICRKCGITEKIKLFYRGKERIMEKWQLVGSHTARRSAITALALRGVPVNIIARLANHTNQQMTDRYICVDVTKLGHEAMSFFN